MVKQEVLFERIKRGEYAIAEAKAQGRDVRQWERHLEAMKFEARRLFPGHHQSKTISCDIEAGEIVAVEIASEVLGAEIWLSFRDDFNPQDGKAIFYADELPVLRDKTAGEVRKIYALKIGPKGLRTRVR